MAKRISVYKKEIIDRHLKIKDHLVVGKKKKENSNNIIVRFVKQYDKNKVTIIQQMQCIYFAAKNYISLNIYPKLCHLVKLKDQNTITTSQILTLSKQIIDNTTSICSSYNTYIEVVQIGQKSNI